MFGYIRTDRPELLVREDEFYKAAYCSLCRTLGRRYGIGARLLLNYDATFVQLLSMALRERPANVVRSRCTVNKCRRCRMCEGASEDENYAADLTVILAYYKIVDNIRDSTFFKALLFRVLLVFVMVPHKKAARLNPGLEAAAAAYMEAQRKVESSGSPTADESADPSAEFGAYVFGNIPAAGNDAEALCFLGRCVGRWVYLADAFDDLPEDRKRGSFNPYIAVPEDDDEIISQLSLTSSMAADALKELKLLHYREIIENIICGGLNKQVQKIRTERSDGSILNSENKQ